MLPQHVPDALTRVDDWVNRLAGLLDQPIKAPVPTSDFVWRHADETAEVLLVSKAVRLASSFAGAWTLACAGLTTEAGSLCRQIGDFAHEIMFIAAAVLQDETNRAQRRFLEFHFRPMARDLETYLSQEKAYWVSRGDILKGAGKLAADAGVDAELQRRLASFISYGLNSYTHGGYESAMELYHGGKQRFMVLGFGDGRALEASVKFVASKGTEVCHGIEAAALALGAFDVSREVAAFVRTVDPYLDREADAV